MLKKILLICIALTLPSLCRADGVFGSRGMNSLFLDPPRMLSPIYETATITDNQPLEFKWMIEYQNNTRGYILCLYKGYNTDETSLILKEEIPQGIYSFQAKADIFQDGQTYTWTLRRIAISGQKTDSSSNSFRVIKN